MRNRFIYKFLTLVCMCFGLTSIVSNGQTANISSNFTDTLLCTGSSFSVELAITGQFDDTNIFRIEMSNATGSFASPVIVGYAYGNGLSSTIANCTLPSSILPGTGYRIRVIAYYPAYTSSPNNKNIRVSDPPVITLATNATLCDGDDLNLTASTTSPAPRYDWTGPNGWNAQNMQSPTRYALNINDSGDYVVTVTSYKCSSKDTIRVAIIPTPVFTGWDSDSFTCEGQKFSIKPLCNVCNLPAGTVNFQWSYPPSGSSKQSYIELLKTGKNNQGWFKVTISVGTCSATDSSFATIKPLPDSPSANNNGPLCVGETLTLNGGSATPGVTYRWEGPNGQVYHTQNVSIPNITKDVEGEWKLFARKDDCDSKPGTTEVKVGIPLIPLPISGDTTLCPGDKLQLSAQAPTTEGIEWKKVPNDSVIISISRTYGKNPVTAEDAGMYVVTQEVLGCKSPPSYVNVIIPDIKNPDAKNNGPLCIGEELKLTATATNNGTYSWEGPGGFTSDGQNPGLDNVTEAAAGVYSVTTTLEFCQATDTTTVKIKPMPEITAVSSNSPVCNFTNLNLFAESSIGKSTFSWEGPNGFKSAEQNPSIFFQDNVSGTYSVRAIADGCVSAAKSTEVVSREGPGLSKARSNGPLQEGEDIELYADNDKDSVAFYWTGPNGFTSNEKNPKIQVSTFRNAGKYELSSVYNGCTTSTFTVVDVKDILGITLELYPNPNDGKFTITGITQTDGLMNVTIFNHQGKIVYQGEIIPEQSKFKTEIDLRGSASGVYLLQVIQGIEKKRVRFTIVRQ